MNDQPRVSFKLEEFGTWMLFGGIVIIGVGNYLGIDQLFAPGVALLGAGVVFSTLNAVMSPDDALASGLRGVLLNGARRAWNLLFAAVGFIVMGIAILYVLRPRDFLVERLTALLSLPWGQGMAMMVVGAMGILYSITAILDTSDSTSSLWTRLAHLPTRLVGLVVLVLSVGLIAIGVIRFVSPETIDRVIQSIARELLSY